MAEILKIAPSGRGGKSFRSRIAPAVTIVLLLIFLAVMAPLLAKYRNAPQVWVEKLEAMSQNQPSAPTTNMNHDVWVNRRSGFYYCHESTFYGKMRPGESMREESALLRGFRPAQGQACR
jgi:hypothetical protein